MTRLHKGFSLIELMVVITIIALLAFFAVPAYNDYVQRAHMTKVFGILENIIDKANNYADANSVFPNATQLGYSQDPAHSGDATYADPSLVSPDLQSLQISDVSSCGKNLRIIAELSADNIINNGNEIIITMDVFNIDGAFVPMCSYVFNTSSGGSYSSENLFPDCVNNYSGSNSNWTALNSQATCL